MTLQEFKAWLEGFEEAFADGAPTPDQWAKVKSKLAETEALTWAMPEAPKILGPAVTPWPDAGGTAPQTPPWFYTTCDAR